jgi:light-regulated signal transduction histidine kinase (bacteriophytochrome)
MRTREVNLNTLVQETIGEMEGEMRGREIVWKIGDLPAVYGDPALLKLVIVNLVSNAVKFTRTRERAEIEIGCTEEKDKFIFFIRDNGVGFDMEHAGKLFGVFQRLHSENEFEGTGIGLANVRRIISRHGGMTWADGSAGKGATFWFSLPRAKEA